MGIRPLLKSTLTILLIAPASAPRAHAEDPARFLQVVGWRGTFSQDVTAVGSGTATGSSDICLVDYSYVHRIQVGGVVLSNLIGFGTSRYWQSDYQQGNGGNIAERHTLQCPNQETLTHTGNGGNMAGYFFLQVDAAANQYMFQFPGLNVTLAVNDNPGVETGVEWSPMVVTNLPTNGMTISGSLALRWEEYGRFAIVPLVIDNLEQILHSTIMTVTWNLEPILEELEVVVEPKGYQNWIPKGNLAAPYTWRGNSIKVAARLQKRGGGTPSVQAESFKFELVTVSKNPGVCMNLPLNNPSDEPDLQFEDDLNAPPPGFGNVINGDRTQIEIVTLNPFFALLETEVALSSFDFGAYGELKVTAKVPGSEEPIVGHLKDGSETNIRIPKTKQGSRIAEAWLKKNGGEGAQLSDDTDQDGFPEGDGHKGDGLSLYEEYRGFVIKFAHLRTKPVKKDLFIRNQISSKEAEGAIQQFQAASQLEVHKVSKSEIDPDNVINFNHDWAHNVDQHALVLVGRQKKTGASEAVSREGATDNSTPGSKSQLEIDPRGSGWGVDLSGGGDGGAVEYSDFHFGSIAHEIGHGCSIWHHGDCDLRRVVWYPATNGTPVIIERLRSGIERPVTISHVNGLEIRPETLFTRQLASGRWIANPYVAVPHGEHSGDTSCIMCYDNARCFLRDTSGARYLTATWPTSNSRFCTSKDGTGVNAPGSSWVGDAHRGNCAGQICVNDLYVNDSKHDRDYTCPAW